MYKVRIRFKERKRKPNYVQHMRSVRLGHLILDASTQSFCLNHTLLTHLLLSLRMLIVLVSNISHVY
jgi:hypothetical protein